MDDQAAARAVEGEKEISNRSHRLYNPGLEEIITNPVPFDAIKGGKQYGALEGFGRLGHRGATPGHDPLAGLVFGTANIATSTLTNWRMESYHIYTGVYGLSKGAQDMFLNRAQTPLVLSRGISCKRNYAFEIRCVFKKQFATPYDFCDRSCICRRPCKSGT